MEQNMVRNFARMAFPNESPEGRGDFFPKLAY